MNIAFWLKGEELEVIKAKWGLENIRKYKGNFGLIWVGNLK
jgi:hypothetical protein